MLHTEQRIPTIKGAGLYVRFEATDLPAKEVLRIAYLIAQAMPLNTKLRFSSGEGTIARLRALGFEAGRKESEKTNKHV